MGTRENHRQAPAPTHNVSKEWNPAHVPLPPDERKAKARVGVGQLESALKAVDPSDPAAVVLQEALRKAQSQARVPPIESQLKVVEEYLNRKKKRLSAVVEAIARRDRFQAEVTEEEKSLARLQNEHQRLQVFRVRCHGHFHTECCSRGGTIADKDCAVAGAERRASVLFKTASCQFSVEGARRAVEGRFCAKVRRRSCPVDARPSSRHARRNLSTDAHATVVPNCGQCSEPLPRNSPTSTVANVIN